MQILVIGGAGYIGSHVCKALKEKNHLPITFDNFSHGHPWAVNYGPIVTGDLLKAEDLDRAFSQYEIDAVIHLASHINVRESLLLPDKYYRNNLIGTLALLDAMVRHGVNELVFSSTAAVYGNPIELPIQENHPKNPVNPYGKSKWLAEQLFDDYFRAYGISTVCLRYFNAAGADLSGQLGEAHNPETHLIPQILLTALGENPHLTIYGDGTAVRDFIHVVDLAEAHLLALSWLKTNQRPVALNLGTGKGYSVSEVITHAERITGKKLPLVMEKANAGDPPILVADSTLAKEMLLWSPRYSDLSTIIETAWHWCEKYTSSIH